MKIFCVCVGSGPVFTILPMRESRWQRRGNKKKRGSRTKCSLTNESSLTRLWSQVACLPSSRTMPRVPSCTMPSAVLPAVEPASRHDGGNLGPTMLLFWRVQLLSITSPIKRCMSRAFSLLLAALGSISVIDGSSYPMQGWAGGTSRISVLPKIPSVPLIVAICPRQHSRDKSWVVILADVS